MSYVCGLAEYVTMENKISSIELFHQNLLEAIAWCTTHPLWTPILQPLGFEECGKMVSQTDEKRLEVVSTLAARRSELLKAQGIAPTRFASEVSQGGLVAFSPDMTLWDGAAEVGSEGFFDSSNMPAWDTWVGFVVESENYHDGFTGWQSYLLAWVPPKYLELADTGIAMNPEVCIDWVQNIQAPFVRELLQWQSGN